MTFRVFLLPAALLAGAAFAALPVAAKSFKVSYIGDKPAQIVSAAGFCLDEDSGKLKKGGRIIAWTCNTRDFPKARQLFGQMKSGQIKTLKKDLCLDVEDGKGVAGERVILWNCNRSGKSQERQRWSFDGKGKKGMLRHASGLCLDVTKDGKRRGEALLQPCDAKNPTQTWTVVDEVPPLPEMAKLEKANGNIYCGAKFANPFEILEFGLGGALYCEVKYSNKGSVPKGRKEFWWKDRLEGLRHSQSWGQPMRRKGDPSGSYKDVFTTKTMVIGLINTAEVKKRSTKSGSSAVRKVLKMDSKTKTYFFSVCEQELKPNQTLVIRGFKDSRRKKGDCFVATKKGKDWGW